MTVGIALTNGREAIVIADSRSTSAGNSRQSDSAEKLLQYQGDSYCGFLLEAGFANHTEATYAELKGKGYDSLDHLVEAVRAVYGDVLDRHDKNYILSQKKEIKKKAMVLDSEEAQAKYIAQETERLLQMFGQRKQNDQGYNSCFAAAGYDKHAERVRLFWINENVSTEIHMPYILLGSGADAAHLYFTGKLQGLKGGVLTVEDIGFHALNAHAFATLNTGVGGTPLIGIIDREKKRVVNVSRAIAAVNISGAYLAEGHEKLTQTRAKEYIASSLYERRPRYKAIARELGINAETLTSLIIPYSSWQEKANR